ncbi:hypothetical protein [Methylocella tundrae]|uniref:hypothetical protein n=1 Tax=Methylocella tundrae TaxID=227605 RepID=UPI00106AECFB|nr:hypothetical protein [Methylocella tundrae]WPP03477.1 hypothetical protein SIN04_13480 [Methylocella tundrae]
MNARKLSIAVFALAAAAANVATAKQAAPVHVCALPTFQEQVREAQNWRQTGDRNGSQDDPRCHGGPQLR